MEQTFAAVDGQPLENDKPEASELVKKEKSQAYDDQKESSIFRLESDPNSQKTPTNLKEEAFQDQQMGNHDLNNMLASGIASTDDRTNSISAADKQVFDLPSQERPVARAAPEAILSEGDDQYSQDEFDQSPIPNQNRNFTSGGDTSARPPQTGINEYAVEMENQTANTMANAVVPQKLSEKQLDDILDKQSDCEDDGYASNQFESEVVTPNATASVKAKTLDQSPK